MERIRQDKPRAGSREDAELLTFAGVEKLDNAAERLAAIRQALEECLSQEHLICPESLRKGVSPFVNGSGVNNSGSWRHASDRHGRPTKLIKGRRSTAMEAYAWEYEPGTSKLLVAKSMYASYNYSGMDPRKEQTVATYWLRPPGFFTADRLKSIRNRSSREICAKYIKGEKTYAYILEYDLVFSPEPARILRRHVSGRFKEGRLVEASILDRTETGGPAQELVIIRDRQGGLRQEITRLISLDPD